MHRMQYNYVDPLRSDFIQLKMLGSCSGLNENVPYWLQWRNNPSVYYVSICSYYWFNKQTDWSIAEKVKIRWERQTENDTMREGGVINQMQRK